MEVSTAEITLKRLASLPTSEEVEFQIDEKTYHCHKESIAVVSEYISSDLLKGTKSYSFKGIRDPENHFEDFIKLLKGEEVEINETNAFLLHCIAKTLKINDLYDATLSYINEEPSISNAIKNVKLLFNVRLDIGQFTSFIAKNWRNLSSTEEFFTLPPPVVDDVIMSEEFVAEETELYDLIQKFVSVGGDEYLHLYRHLVLPNLPPESAIQIIDSVDMKTLTPDMWDSLMTLMDNNIASLTLEPKEPINIPSNNQQPPVIQKTVQTQAIPKPQKTVTIEYAVSADEEYPLDGIFSYIIHKYPDSYKYKISLSGGGSKQSHIYKILDYDYFPGFWWDNYDMNLRECRKENAWLSIRFVGYKLSLSGYTLGSSALEPFSHQPKSWVLEASNDGINWSVVHRQKDCSRMNARYALQVFKLPESTPRYSMFKITLLENFHKKPSNAWEFSIGALELFGTLS